MDLEPSKMLLSLSFLRVLLMSRRQFLSLVVFISMGSATAHAVFQGTVAPIDPIVYEYLHVDGSAIERGTGIAFRGCYLTAAHVVIGFLDAPNSQAMVKNTKGLNNLQMLNAKNIKIHDGYRKEMSKERPDKIVLSKYDIALAKADKVLPQSYPIEDFATEEETEKFAAENTVKFKELKDAVISKAKNLEGLKTAFYAFAKITILGYGRFEDDAVKKNAFNRDLRQGSMVASPVDQNELLWLTAAPSYGAPGDSGGPLKRNFGGKEKLYALVSHANAEKKVVLAMLYAKHFKWMEDAAKALHCGE
jgi:hypothetical protein